MTEHNSDHSPNQMFNRFVQIGVVVADLEKVTRNLTQVFGIGPFRIIDWPPAGRDYVERIYHGQPANFTARMAFAELGSIELEIIQPLDGPSIWADFLRNQGGGIHHIRFNVEQVEPVQAYLAQHSVLAAQQGSGIRPGTEWMNFASEKLVGFVIEVMKVAPGTDGRTPQIVDGKVVEGP